MDQSSDAIQKKARNRRDLLTCLGVGALAIPALFFMSAMASVTGLDAERSKKKSVEVVREAGLRCEREARSRLKNPNSYDGGGWLSTPRAVHDGRGGYLLSKKFHATNSFGGVVPGEWTCRVDGSGRVIEVGVY